MSSTTENTETRSRGSILAQSDSERESNGRPHGLALLEKELTGQIIAAAIEVHKHWGPGLYEEIYEKSLCCELAKRGIACESQLALPLIYKGTKVGDDLQLDLLVDERIVVEVKTVSELVPVHEAQLLTYMKLAKCRVGLLINFNVPVLTQGIKRRVL